MRARAIDAESILLKIAAIAAAKQAGRARSGFRIDDSSRPSCELRLAHDGLYDLVSGESG